jgi:hypothetical protein
MSAGSELIALFTDYEDRHAPLDNRGMRLTVTADLAFIEVGNLKEERIDGSDVTTFTSAISIGVDAELLLHALTSMVRCEDRDAEIRARTGHLQADHPAWTTVSQVVPVPAVRKRA